ncbi:Predicted ATPase [Mesonia phycicola]|uniref:Predicted ATPase n=1 Tax=Mesonia phycicola TaxID=579105 RepID=A0A1M6DR49_9FLAO|nr:ATP-binding protein [Mesonia phycicola]SHI75665.1 Predicted ATPase [Mesonia phycicola]
MHKHSKIVILGGPGTGKSSVLQELEDRGYTCFKEVSREIILKAQKDGIEQLFLTNPLLFSEKLLEGRIFQFNEATKVNQPVFIDRGIPDISAYMDFKKENYPSSFTEANKSYKYHQAFILPIWPDIYTSDNERYESLEEAFEIEKNLIKTYSDLDYQLIEVPKLSVKERADFILKNIEQ